MTDATTISPVSSSGRAATSSIENSIFTNVRGDCIWGWEIARIKLIKNRVEVCEGAAADNVHLYAPRGFRNPRKLLFDGRQDRQRQGQPPFGRPEVNGVVEGNVLRGGNYGVGMADSNLIVRNNQFFNHDKEKWSAAIIVSGVLRRERQCAFLTTRSSKRTWAFTS